jgi:hypothetical protein
MLTIDCPFCGDHAQIDGALTTITCDDCGLREDIAPDLVRPVLGREVRPAAIAA